MTIARCLPERLGGVPWALGVFALFALLAAPFDAEAQGRGNGKNKGGNGNGRGSVHCRNGNGHPVHGRQWCRDKGWDTNQSILGTRDRRDDGRIIVVDRDRDRDRDRDDDDVIVIDRDRDRDRDEDRDRDRRAEPRIRWPF